MAAFCWSHYLEIKPIDPDQYPLVYCSWLQILQSHLCPCYLLYGVLLIWGVLDVAS